MLPFRSGRPLRRRMFSALAAVAVLLCSWAIAQPEKEKNALKPGAIPLPVGHEAKGLVLPDYDEEGRLRARVEAATAQRIDEERIQFTGVKLTTYNVETATPDLSVDLPSATFDLETRVISSDQRTTLVRSDVQVAGDTMEFDTAAKRGKLVGNVKMVITGANELGSKQRE